MSVYCMSDLHGMREAFHEMLEKIHFSQKDTLYIIGDVIDRGPEGMEILQEIMASSQMHLILGNHEYMMLEALLTKKTDVEIRRWARNGNAPTLAGWRKFAPEEQKNIFEYLQAVPDFLQIRVGKRDYYLVHGFPGENTHDRVWGRPESAEQKPSDVTGQLIIGHTPVPYLLCQTEEEENRYFEKMKAMGALNAIVHGEGFWDIDCSCGHSDPGAALGCICLDDLHEFYVPGRRQNS